MILIIMEILRRLMTVCSLQVYKNIGEFPPSFIWKGQNSLYSKACPFLMQIK